MAGNHTFSKERDIWFFKSRLQAADLSFALANFQQIDYTLVYAFHNMLVLFQEAQVVTLVVLTRQKLHLESLNYCEVRYNCYSILKSQNILKKISA